MKVLTYDDQNIEMLQCTKDPVDMVCTAAELTTGKPIKDRAAAIEFMLKANHTSLFEHCFITLLIGNVSRSFLAQITRHRMSSFTSGSQHYQDYRNYPAVIHPALSDVQHTNMKIDCQDAVTRYGENIDLGIPHDEARQVLPNAMAVNILWTINARSLINFLNLRLCRRNVAEMVSFANYLHRICMNWFPELFTLVGPDCFMTECRQGAMSCDYKTKALCVRCGKPFDYHLTKEGLKCNGFKAITAK